MIAADPNTPSPETHLATKVLAAKNTPSARFPVRTSLSSTTSANIDAIKIDQMIVSVVVVTLKTISVGSSADDPFSGK